MGGAALDRLLADIQFLHSCTNGSGPYFLGSKVVQRADTAESAYIRQSPYGNSLRYFCDWLTFIAYSFSLAMVLGAFVWSA
jgi:hypothetical protein